MKTLETIAKAAKSNRITQVCGKHGWVNIDLELTSVAINTLKDYGARLVSINGHDYGINELAGLPDGEFARL